jgi:adenylate cyclase
MSLRHLRGRLRRWVVRRSQWLVTNVIVLGLCLAFVIVSSLPVLRDFEPAMTDFWYRLRGQISPPDKIVLIAIDPESHSLLDVPRISAWPRQRVVELIDKLAVAKMKRLIFDLFFVDKGSDAAIDASLAQAFARVPTYLGAFISKEETSKNEDGVTVPRAEFSNAARGVVLMNVDANGTTRHFHLFSPDPQGVPPLVDSVISSESERTLTRPGPWDLIHFYGPPGTIRTVSFARVLTMPDEQVREVFNDTTVIVGPVLPVGAGLAAKDTFLTPTGPKLMAGAEIHATVLGNILSGHWIRRATPFTERCVGLALITVAALIGLTLQARLALLSVGLMVLLWLCVSYQYFLWGHLVPGRLACLVFAPIALLCGLGFRYARSSSRWQRLSRALELEADE